MEYFDFLKRVYFFKNLTDEEISLVLSSCQEGTCRTGHIICDEGEIADKFYIIVEGSFAVYKNYHDTKPDLLAEHGAGSFFGEMALVDELPRSATVVAKEDSRYLYLSRKDFQRLIGGHVSIALSVMTSMSFLVRSSNELFVEDLRKRNQQLENAYSDLEHAQAEQIRNERLSTLGKFSSMVLHDIRNPIAIIKGQLQLMLMHLEDSDRLRKFIANVDTEAGKLERLAGEFLDYSRGEIRLNFSIMQPALFIGQVLETIAPQMEKLGIAVKATVDNDDPVLLDCERIQRVLNNLIDNARKACKDSPVKQIEIRAGGNDERFTLSVSDSGVGMSDEIKARVFEPFFSASGAGGTGLGLLIVKNVVEAHGGTLNIESQPGEGTSFSISIPRRA